MKSITLKNYHEHINKMVKVTKGQILVKVNSGIES
jgi:hypothetical protein